MAKRTRPLKLKIAKNAGWIAEFPCDLWNVIIPYLPTENKHAIPDLSLMLSLMAVSKSICRLFTPIVIGMLCDALAFVRADKRPAGRDRLFWRISLFFEGVKQEGRDLRAYMTQCISDKDYQTPEHMTNCVSLLHLANCEIAYLKSHEWASGGGGRKIYSYSPLIKSKGYSINWDLYNVKYFKTTKTRVKTSHAAVTLSLMKEVGTVRHFTHPSPEGGPSLYDQAISLLKKKDDNDERLAKLRALTSDRLSFHSLIIDVLTETAPVKTTNTRGRDHLEDILVTIDGRQRYFFSDAAASFRERCFFSKMTVEKATKEYILDSMHERNWAIVTKSDRFLCIK